MEEAAEGECRVEVLLRSLELEGAIRALLSESKKETTIIYFSCACARVRALFLCICEHATVRPNGRTVLLWAEESKKMDHSEVQS